MRLVWAISATALLTGCQVSGNFGGAGGGYSEVDLAELRAPVARVERLALGRTRNGLALTAFGAAQGGGWSSPALKSRGLAADGLVELEFLAIPPQATETGDAALRADVLLTSAEMGEARGFRVIARDNQAEIEITR